MRRDVAIFYRLLDQRHVAFGALTARAVLGAMGMFTHCPLESRSILAGVASKAERISLLSQVRFILITVHIVAIEAANLPMIHIALDEIVSLHTVLVRS